MDDLFGVTQLIEKTIDEPEYGERPSRDNEKRTPDVEVERFDPEITTVR